MDEHGHTGMPEFICIHDNARVPHRLFLSGWKYRKQVRTLGPRMPRFWPMHRQSCTLEIVTLRMRSQGYIEVIATDPEQFPPILCAQLTPLVSSQH